MKSKRRNTRRKTLLTIIILLALCILATMYILALVRGSDDQSQVDNEASTETEAVVEEPQEDTVVEEEPEVDAHAEAAKHIYAHRGAGGEDELSAVAYEKAVAAGAKYIEADMVVSADGTIYVAHDDYAQDMTGIKGYFSGMTDGQIDALKTRAGNSIIKLSDLFDKYGDSVTYLIDIKYTSSRNIVAFNDIVQKYGYEDNVIATSFYLDALRAVENTFPDMKKCYLCSDQATFNAALGYNYTDIMCVPVSIMTEDNLKAAHDNDKVFSAWTLNTEDEIKSAIELGVDTYFTDDTALAIGLEEQFRTE